jgi:hypothetical protein
MVTIAFVNNHDKSKSYPQHPDGSPVHWKSCLEAIQQIECLNRTCGCGCRPPQNLHYRIEPAST